MGRPGIRRSYALAATGQLIQVATSLIGVALLARLLGPADFGLFVLLSTVVILSTMVLISGLQWGSLAVGAKDERNYPQMHGLITVIGLLGAVGAVVATLVAASSVGETLLSTVGPTEVSATAFRIAATAYSGLVGTMLAATGRIGLMALLLVITALTSLAAVMGAAYEPEPLTGAVVGAMVGSILTAVAASGLAFKALGVPARPHRALTSAVAHVAIPMQIGTFGFWLMLRGDAFVVNAALGGASVGIYALALTISERIGFVTTPLYNATAWRVVGPDKGLALTTTVRLVRIELAVAFGAVVATWVLAPIAVQLLGGPGYEDAVVPLAILALGAAVLPLWSTVGLYLTSQLGLAWQAAALQIALAAAAMIAYVLIVPHFGLAGAATVSTFSYLALVGAGLLLIRHDSAFSILPRRNSPLFRDVQP
jgi:O-antigen/teichoic acid export membrane protein